MADKAPLVGVEYAGHMEARMAASDTYEVFAVKYATRNAKRVEHFLDKASVQNPDDPMPMDYYVWLVRNDDRSFVVDTGFSEPVGTRRGRTYLRRPRTASNSSTSTPRRSRT